MKTKLTILFLLFATTMMAQELKLKHFNVDLMDLSAKKYPIKDANDEPCALVKVEFAEPDVVFVGDAVLSERKKGEWWVYLTEGATYLEVRTDNYLPFKYEFPEPLVKNHTYIMTLVKENKHYLKESGFYFGVSYDVAQLSGIAGHVGGTYKNIDLQLSYQFGIAKSDFANYYSQTDGSLRCRTQYAINSFSVKGGYQLPLTSRFAIVPQIGYTMQNLQAKTEQGTEKPGDGASNNLVTIGAKLLYTPFSHTCIYLGPEYGIGVSSDKVFDNVAEIVGLNKSGFNCSIGLLFNF